MLSYLFIFVARVLDMSMFTVRMLFLVKGKRTTAAILGFFEVIVYVVALGKVVSGLSDPRNLLAYALGYACGNYVGAFIEEKLAVGKLTAQIITPHCDEHTVANHLRENGFGVTVLEGQGKVGKRLVLNVMLERKNINKLYRILDEIAKDPFITVFDIKSIRGGYVRKMKRK